MRFRFHKSTIADSLETQIEVLSKEDLFNAIKEYLKPFVFDFCIDDIECSYYGFDNRINWDTYLITLKNYGVIGMTDQEI